jgi:signal transduction histidine kinase/CheY-like chemotaxis protein
MNHSLLTVAIRLEHDVVQARQRARDVAALLDFPARDQVRIATAVSEIARNAFQYAGRGKVEFFITEDFPQRLCVRVSDPGGGIPNLKEILQGQYTSRTGMGQGILGARRLMDDFTIQSAPNTGTIVDLSKALPTRAQRLNPSMIASIVGKLAQAPAQNPMEELQRQNQELLGTLEELEKRQTELAQLNRELEDTNRGVVALYAELDERADYLRRASELKTQFLSNMTHEFRTPLNSILSLSRILLDRVDGELSREQERQVKFIQKAATDLSELVNDLLDLAKVEAGKVTIRPVEFQVSELFGALRGMLRPLLAHNSSVALTFEKPQGIPLLHTDDSKVSQILRNLLSNALKYTERGEVRVSARIEAGQQVAFEVADTGIGITSSDQDRIFEEFTQIEGPHQAGKRGTGLGLPLSRKLAELLGGTLTVKSEVGAGSTFILRIPVVYQGAAEASFVPEPVTELDRTRLPVLVVEDNCETLLVYEKYLKGTPFQAIPARTLKQARQALDQFHPTAIILDILLNHENAWTFLTDLKAHEATRQIPVYVVTIVENQQKARSLGADDFHTKPIDRQWLLAQLDCLVQQQAAGELLVVDDDEVSRYVLRGLLSETRFRVVETSSGVEALELARERRPSAIFLDLMMPGKSGFEVLNDLKLDAKTRDIPIVVHTAKMLSTDERDRLADQTIAIIPKTHIDRQASLKMIREALARAGVHALNPQEVANDGIEN